MVHILSSSDGVINIKSVNDKKLNSKLNATIKKVTDDIEKRFNFNTAISSIMELVNELYKYKQGEDLNTPLLEDAITKLVTLLSPFTPHICEEMWHELGKEDTVRSKLKNLRDYYLPYQLVKGPMSCRILKNQATARRVKLREFPNWW